MTQIDRHPLLQQAYEVCLAIEECGASPQLTNAVTKASALLAALDKFIPVAAESDKPAQKPESWPVRAHESHVMVDSPKLGGQVCKNCGVSMFSSRSKRHCGEAESSYGGDQ